MTKYNVTPDYSKIFDPKIERCYPVAISLPNNLKHLIDKRASSRFQSRSDWIRQILIRELVDELNG